MSSGSLPELIEKAPARSLRQILGTVALWAAVATTAGVAVALALVVAPGRDEGTAAAQDRMAGRDGVVPAMAAATASAAAAARQAIPPTTPAATPTPPATQTAAVSPGTERPPADRLAAIHNAQPPRQQHRRAAARASWPRFQPFGHTFAWSSSRNRWR